LEGVIAIMAEHERKMAMEHMRAHLARADGELAAALRFVDPRTDEEAEIDLVRAVANTRTSVRDALERIRVRLGEPR
jgi:DNA invertase Pin-like site-specific DNA recombinase